MRSYEGVRPVLVVVHGPPGSGKSTLARALGTELGLPVLDRDDLKDTMFDRLGWSDREWSSRVGATSWDLLRLCIERLVGGGASLIAETNFRPSDPFCGRLREVLAGAGAAAVEVHCTAAPDVLWERFDGRRRSGGRHPGHVGFEECDVFLADLVARPHGPLGLGVPLIELDTTTTWPDPVDVARRVRTALSATRLRAMPNDWARPVVHWEIEAIDPDRLRAFYGALFNWDIGDGPIMSVPAGIGGPEPGPGGHLRAGERSRVTLYVQVRDLRESMERAADLGGAVVMEPFDVPGGPTLAGITDPEGNPVMLVQQ